MNVVTLVKHESHKREWQFLSFMHAIISQTISHKPPATSVKQNVAMQWSNKIIELLTSSNRFFTLWIIIALRKLRTLQNPQTQID